MGDGKCKDCGTAHDMDDEPLREKAREIYENDSDEEIKIDEGAPIARGYDCGAFVQAWVWVQFGGE